MRLGFVTLLLSGAPALQAPAPAVRVDSAQQAAVAPPADQPLVRELAIVLRRARDPKAEERPRLASELAELGPAAIAPLLDVLETARVPAALPTQRVQALSIYQKEVLLGGLAELGSSRVLRAVDDRLALNATDPCKLAALEVIGAVGDRDRIKLAFELATPDADQPVDSKLAKGLRAALAKLVVRDPLAIARLRATWRSLPSELLDSAVYALGDARDGRGLSFAVDAALAHPRLVPLVVAQIVLIGRAPDPDANRKAVDFLLSQRDRVEGTLACTVTRALAVLEDEGSVQRWIDELADESEPLRSAAHWSLSALSRLTYPAEPEPWQVWWDAELTWFDERYDALLDDLGSADPGEVSNALRELATRRIRRHEIAAQIEPLLEDERAPVRKLACDALNELGSTNALAALTRALRDEDPEVAGAAWRALEHLSGRNYAQDSIEWDELVAAREP
jgi:HEAT repeat protein